MRDNMVIYEKVYNVVCIVWLAGYTILRSFRMSLVSFNAFSFQRQSSSASRDLERALDMDSLKGQSNNIAHRRLHMTFLSQL
jgi:hypothetical protein